MTLDPKCQAGYGKIRKKAFANCNFKWMIEVALRGTTGQTRTNRQVTQPIQKTRSNTHKIPETTGKQPSKEGELKCYKCGQKWTHVTSVPKTEELMHSDGKRR